MTKNADPLTNHASANGMPLGTFLLLRDLFSNQLGIWFDEDKRDILASKLGDRIGALKLHSFLDYFYYLKYDPAAAQEWLQVTDLLSVQETYFWREFDQIRAFVDVLVPQFAESTNGPLRIWSAACATGEEPLTLAMALNEAGWFNRLDIQIVASDISPSALQHATKGLYRDRSFRVLSPRLREKYFTKVEQGWQVDPLLMRRVKYQRANLLNTEEIAELAAANFIFCRNVFIYFSKPCIAQILENFARSIAPPGFLFVGVSESLLRFQTKFEMEQIAEAFVYKIDKEGK
jgi:chemotaxis protein methyltransferase CheR